MFKNYKVDFNKLISYGFIKIKNSYQYTVCICEGQFELIIQVDEHGLIKTQLYDVNSKEEYVLHLMEDVAGEFVGKIRGEYQKILQDIKDNCFERHVFKSEQAQQVTNYIKTKYNDELEYLWEKFPTNAIWRRKDNKKWYGALLVIPKSKLGLEGDNLIEILDLRIDSEKLEALIDNKKFFAGYHMNKRHWFTICLDGSIETEELYNLIDNSYQLAKR